MKQKIPKALRESVWRHHHQKNFESKCMVSWCNNTVNVFDFECGHNIAEAKGGPTTLENLRPICSKCNKSMGTKSIDEFSELVKVPPKWEIWESFRFCKGSKVSESD